MSNARDRIDTLPSVAGPHGLAWTCDLDAIRNRLGVAGADDAMLALWVVEAPWAHPLWHSYLISLVHLRPLPDNRRTIFYLPDATHELIVSALDPEAAREPVILGLANAATLQPDNFGAQFVAAADATARNVIKTTVQSICDGFLNPDTDARIQWVELFGDNMMCDRANARPPIVRGLSQ